MKRSIIKAGVTFIILVTIVLSAVAVHNRRETRRAEQRGQPDDPEGDTKDIQRKESVEEEKEIVRVEDLSFDRVSRREIKIVWQDQKNPYVCEYLVKRRIDGESSWEELGTVASDGRAEDRELSYVDVLETEALKQYEYRVDVKIAEEDRYEAGEGENIAASNILICMDPGHYAGQNAVNVDGIPYAEGDFTLELALELKTVLKESYGITAYLTRESGSVSIGGYTDGGLDSGHISLRGEYAEGSDLFLSLHTNANLEDANGYPTYAQPVEIMKPIVILNTAACESDTALAVGNAVGIRLARSSYELGIAMPDKFRSAACAEEIIQWTDAWNDGVEEPGTLCRRLGEHGDYYGVLRGAANVGVPGMIIEHGFHTVPKMREAAAGGELKERWARADAEGIAEGFGLKIFSERMEEGRDVL